MQQQEIRTDLEAFEAKLSWEDMVELNIQVDYDAIIFPMDSNAGTSSAGFEISPSGGAQQVTSSAGLKISPSGEAQQVTSAGLEISPSGEAQQVTSAGLKISPSGEAQQVTSSGLEISPSGEAQKVTSSGLEISPSGEAQQVTSSAGLKITPSGEAQQVTSDGLEISQSGEAQQVTSSAGLEISPSGEAQQVTSSAGLDHSLSVEDQQDSNSFADSLLVNSVQIHQAGNPFPVFLPIPSTSLAPGSYQHFQCGYSNRELTQAFSRYEAPHCPQPKRSRNPNNISAFNHYSKYIEQATKHITSLTKQVDDLKKHLQRKTFDLDEEREQRIRVQVECTSYLKKIMELEETLENERHTKAKCEQKEEEQERSVAEDIPKAAIYEDLLNELNFLKKQAEKHDLNNAILEEALVEERQLRLKCEDKLKNYLELDTKCKEQEKKIQSMQSYIVNLTVELNLASKDDDYKVPSRKHFSNRSEVSTPSEVSTKSQISSPLEVSMPSEASTQLQESIVTSHHANTRLHTISGSQQQKSHHPNGSLNGNKRIPPYRGPQGNPVFNANQGFYPNPNHYSNPGHHPNPRRYPNSGSYANPGLYPNTGFNRNRRHPTK
ncbi:uncharacterized protein LOC103465509 [Poecilia reticulata]|uniref:uncharacterized protein LOC103465509 n=1 Tax=Poecilia reticulata TaxID=8081 RepID=UPI0004A24B0B|nr:PREDICTED: uncharacterized protein LOC103465509 [Poecilia reticulata]